MAHKTLVDIKGYEVPIVAVALSVLRPLGVITGSMRR